MNALLEGFLFWALTVYSQLSGWSVSSVSFSLLNFEEGSFQYPNIHLCLTVRFCHPHLPISQKTSNIWFSVLAIHSNDLGNIRILTSRLYHRLTKPNLWKWGPHIHTFIGFLGYSSWKSLFYKLGLWLWITLTVRGRLSIKRHFLHFLLLTAYPFQYTNVFVI